MTRKILFLGGPESTHSQLRAALHQEPYELVTISTASEAQTYLENNHVSVVVAHETLDAMRGADFLAAVYKTSPATVRVMVTDAGESSALIDAVNQAEIYRLVAQPIVPATLARILRDALNLARVAEAQEAVWSAARQQQDAIARLNDKAVSAREAESAVMASRFAGARSEAHGDSDRIGELPNEHVSRLSARENEIVQALGSGRRVKDIAQDLVISTHTVRNHLKAIYRKLNVRSQFELISLMARHSREQ